jgi:bifunctional non-homologous end joining protein LigD
MVSSDTLGASDSTGARTLRVMADTDETVTVEGRRITLTHLDKVLYPSTGTTKRDVLAYYAEIGPALIPHASHRPVTRKRWVHGVGTSDAPGTMFFQKNTDDSTPAWVTRQTIKHKDHSTEYPELNDLPTLVWLAQVAALELHVPQWQFGAAGQPRHPDRLVLDLDPGEGVGLAECAEIARYVQDILSDMGLEALPVTSGSKGIHLYAPLDGKQDSEQVSAVAHELARALEADHPDLVVSDMSKNLRRGKVLIDWSQNSAAKTTIVPYSLRGRFEPTVAAPRTWEELESPDLRQLDYREVLHRVEQSGDLLRGLIAPAVADRLATYRSMRAADKTPEPFSAATTSSADGHTFVIQEHHASQLHYDFRLEHDGVLVSWALPKGVPTSHEENHLAVQTEDHPIDYGSFEGTIPAGQYGAGTVSIWDTGTYSLEKWREGKEIIVVLRGADDGGLGDERRIALIHTGTGKNWLIHLMQPSSESRPKPEPELVPEPAPEPVPEQLPKAMLATLGSATETADETEWAFEMKWDGIRAIATVANGAVTAVSRNGHDLTAAYPELANLAAAVRDRPCTVDGEIVALDRAGRPDFSRLQQRLNLTKPSEIARTATTTPVNYFVFDILSLDGHSLLDEPWQERRATLETLVVAEDSSAVQVPPVFDGTRAAAIDTSRELGLEGIVAKRRDAPYESGRRSTSWIKIKHHRTQEVVVVGWRPGNGRREHGIGSLLLAVPNGAGLDYVGRVGTGFTDRMLDDIATLLLPLSSLAASLDTVPATDARDVRWVRPELVAEVEFAEWTRDGRLRQPVWRGWRTDKTPADVRRE